MGTTSRVEVYGQAVRGVLELEPDGNRRAKYLDFIDIYANLTDNERERYVEQYPEENQVMAGIVQTAREEGIEQGMRRGRVDGERAVLQRQLRRRFGSLSPEVAERVGEASAADIETWADKGARRRHARRSVQFRPLESTRRARDGPRWAKRA